MSLLQRPKILFILFGLLVLALQPIKTGFESGHHGWVSAHVLSQIAHASPENFFLGYTQKTVNPVGFDYIYFDRYPIIFSGLMHTLLSPFWDHLSSYIYVARQLMNLIFLFTAFFLWRFVRQFARNQQEAVAVFLLVLSSSLFIKYKDMVHFDQITIFSILLLINGIVDYEKKGLKKLLLTGCLLGPLLGRGYAVIFFIAGWAILRFFRDFKTKRAGALRSIPWAYCLMSVPLPALMLAANIMSEAHIRKLAWNETSIVISAYHRLGFGEYKTKFMKVKNVTLPSFLSNQLQRTFDFLTPYPLYSLHVKNYKKKLQHYISLLPKAIFQLFILYLLIKFFMPFWRQMDPEAKFQLSVPLAGGALWMIVMKNLAHYHEYVTLYLFGFVIVFWLFAVKLMADRKIPIKRLAFMVMAVSLLSNLGIGQYVAGTVSWQAREFQKIRQEMKEKNIEKVYLTDDVNNFFLDGVKWGDSFYLTDFAIAHNPALAQAKIVYQDKEKLMLVPISAHP